MLKSRHSVHEVGFNIVTGEGVRLIIDIKMFFPSCSETYVLESG